MKIWNSPAGPLRLERRPFPGENSHQAWDAADEWICSRFPEAAGSVLLIGEAFGVLSCAWGKAGVTAVSDSSLSLTAAEYNRKLNAGHCTGPFRSMAINRLPEHPAPADTIFIRLPKNLDLLEIYIAAAMRFASETTGIWLGGMDKRWNSGVKKITDRMLEPAEVFPFERRARWIRFNPGAAVRKTSIEKTWKLEKYPVLVKSAPAVFSAARIDEGTAAFLSAFPEREADAAAVIADMGCGSGLLGLSAAALNMDAEIIFSDESFLAVSAAKENAEINGFSERSGFHITNGLTGVPDGSVDLVLCNPPFHFQNIQSAEPADFMFSEAFRVLRKKGTLQIVGNNHLGYHKHLKKYFPAPETALRNRKFTVVRGIRP